MSQSYFESKTLQCRRCSAEFCADVCLILHVTDDTPQFVKLVKGVCHDFLCPVCDLPQQVNASFLIVHPVSNPALIFCPEFGVSLEETRPEYDRLLDIFRKNLAEDEATRKTQALPPVTVDRVMLRKLLPKPPKSTPQGDIRDLLGAFNYAQTHGILALMITANSPNLAQICGIFELLAKEVCKPYVPPNPNVVFDVCWIRGLLTRCIEIGVPAAFAERVPS